LAAKKPKANPTAKSPTMKMIRDMNHVSVIFYPLTFQN